jgi:signal transduction histidine kinase/ActR/RegA family two-component response regulator
MVSGSQHSVAPCAPVTISDVDIRSELLSRPHRLPNYQAEERALAGLARQMSENPRHMLQTLAEAALDLCRADTAGISLLEGDVFRWEALAGVCATKRHGTMPRNASPCGICIDQNTTQLMRLPDRCFPALINEPRFVEALLLPFHLQGRAIGTVWVVAHTFDRHFDQEDQRLVAVLAQFASAGWQLWKACEAAEEASRQKDQFLAVLSHELRNPLNALSTALAVGRLSEARRDRALGLAERQCRYLGRLIEDLLDVARVTQGKLVLHREDVSLQQALGQAVENARHLVEEHGHALSVSLPADKLLVNGDPVRLVQIITNLLMNAAKFTQHGGRIDVAVERRGAEVALSIRDTGSGIAGAMLPHVFDLFAQAGRTLDRAEGGMGIGLAVAKNLAELHGGRIEAHSDGPGRGSVFVMHLPVLATIDRPPPPQGLGLCPTATRVRVLLVEDDLDAAEGMTMLLELLGHEVRTVHDGIAALTEAARTLPEVVLIDIGLPQLDGYEVAARMRSMPGMRQAVLVALTGYGTTADVERAFIAGFEHHLTKPVDLERVEALFAKIGSRFPVALVADRQDPASRSPRLVSV